MSDTPRTDALVKRLHASSRIVTRELWEHAQDLERELADARGLVRELEAALENRCYELADTDALRLREAMAPFVRYAQARQAGTSENDYLLLGYGSVCLTGADFSELLAALTKNPNTPEIDKCSST